MKKFAMFLPQFHEIPENNKWWGTGFTEWTKVKAAVPLYKQHIQPLIPLNHYFYNLLDRRTVEWQTDLMKQFKIDGFVYYHYYFCGKKLLEQPAENLLKWKDIHQPFFFCWANHTWYRSWNNSKEPLIVQTYGQEADWERHFNYLLPFFQDERYEKKGNKPVFMVFCPDFKEKAAIFNFFNQKCMENGFDGIYLIETYLHKDHRRKTMQRFQSELCSQTELIYIHEPSVSTLTYNTSLKNIPVKAVRKFKKFLSGYEKRIGILPYNGNKLYDHMLHSKLEGENFAHGIFFEWDNTPRHFLRGYVITPPKKEKFFEYMNFIQDDEYVFINAWNEWAEGMILEPTEQNGYKYLEWLKEWTDTHENKEQL